MPFTKWIDDFNGILIIIETCNYDTIHIHQWAHLKTTKKLPKTHSFKTLPNHIQFYGSSFKNLKKIKLSQIVCRKCPLFRKNWTIVIIALSPPEIITKSQHPDGNFLDMVKKIREKSWLQKFIKLLIQIQKKINNINICSLPFVVAYNREHSQFYLDIRSDIKAPGLPSSSTKWLSIIVTQSIAYWTISETKLKTHEFPIFFVPQMSTYVLWGRILPGSTFEKCFGGLFKPVVLCTQQKEACGYDWVRV